MRALKLARTAIAVTAVVVALGVSVASADAGSGQDGSTPATGTSGPVTSNNPWD